VKCEGGGQETPSEHLPKQLGGGAFGERLPSTSSAQPRTQAQARPVPSWTASRARQPQPTFRILPPPRCLSPFRSTLKRTLPVTL